MTEIIRIEIILIILYMIFLLTVVLCFDILKENKGDGVRLKLPRISWANDSYSHKSYEGRIFLCPKPAKGEL